MARMTRGFCSAAALPAARCTFEGARLRPRREVVVVVMWWLRSGQLASAEADAVAVAVGAEAGGSPVAMPAGGVP